MDILIVDDERSIRESTLIAVEAEGHYAETADCREVALQRLREENFQLMMLDLRLGSESGLEVLKDAKELFPNLPVVVFTAHASIETAVEATRLGALDYLEKPFSPDQLRAVLARAQKFQKMEHKIAELETEVSTTAPPNEFESADPEMRRAYEMLFRAAPTGATVLILGESGTGKSVVAKAVHENSHLKVKPFVTVSCPSLSKELLESELFGHVKGAFTGAVKDTWGKVKAAEGGTLFLDEIGELPLEIQPKLLRLLQEKEYERVGENKARKSDVRIIAATNRNLQECVRAGQFREDLFYRLNVISVEMPPLRARPEDLRRFAQNYLQFFAGQMKRAIKGFTPEAEAFLMGYAWPGNLRELRNAIERATILTAGPRIGVEDLPAQPALLPPPTTPANGSGPPLNGSSNHRPAPRNPLEEALGGSDQISLADLEAAHIARVLDRSRSLSQAAKTLGIDQATLYRKRKKLGLG